MRYALKTLLLLSTLFLIGCSAHIPPNECKIFKRISFSRETKDWLQDKHWPSAVYTDFDKVKDHNRVYACACEQQTNICNQKR